MNNSNTTQDEDWIIVNNALNEDKEQKDNKTISNINNRQEENDNITVLSGETERMSVSTYIEEDYDEKIMRELIDKKELIEKEMKDMKGESGIVSSNVNNGKRWSVSFGL